MATLAISFSVLSFFGVRYAFSDEVVSIYATVGLTNQPPVVTSVNPSTSPTLVERNSYQNYSLQLSDSDSTSILYTISTSSGAVIPSSGTVPLTAGSAQVNFTYFAPSYKARLVPVYVTLDDQSGNPPIVKQVDVYVY
jgi:hypothetical protein